MLMTDRQMEAAEESLNLLSEQIWEITDQHGFHAERGHVRGCPNLSADLAAIALIHSELSEGLETLRKDRDKQDEHIPDYKSIEVEMADCIIRILDFCACNDLNVGGALIDKMLYNAARPHLHGKLI